MAAFNKDEGKWLPISEEALDILHRAKALMPSPDCRNVFPNRLGEQRTTFGNT